MLRQVLLPNGDTLHHAHGELREGAGIWVSEAGRLVNAWSKGNRLI